MLTIRFDTEREFGAFFCLLHFGIVLASNLHRDRTLIDVAREAKLDALLQTISDVDPSQTTPAGTQMRQLRAGSDGAITVDGDMLAMIDRYVRYGAERCAPDWAATAAVALDVVARAHAPA